MNDRRRPSSRKDRNSASGAGTSPPSSRGGRDRGRRRAGGGEGSATTNDARTSSGAIHPLAPSAADEPRRRRRPPQDPPQQRSYPQPPKAASNDKAPAGKRRSNKERHYSRNSSMLAAMDALDTFKTIKPSLLTPRKYKKLSSSAASVGDFSHDRIFDLSPQGIASVNATAPTYKSSTDIASSFPIASPRASAPNPNSRQRQRGQGATRNKGAPRSSRPKPHNDGNQPSSPNRGNKTGALQRRQDAAAAKKNRSPRHQSRKDGNITRSSQQQTTRERTKTKLKVNLIPPRIQNDLQTRRRQELDVACVCDEDGNVELDVAGLGSVDPMTVYNCQFSPRQGIIEKQTFDDDESDEERPGSRLGKNGWHRALDTINPPDNSDIRNITSRSMAEYEDSLDQFTATHLLQDVHPQVDEFDAIQKEYKHLLAEVKALEKDRVQLEAQFHEAGRVSSQKSLKEQMTYQTFRTNLRYMKLDDIKTLPVMWLEDIPLSHPEQHAPDKRKMYAKLDEPFQDLIRNHRGTGLALLIADPQCKSSLIGRCYVNSNYGAAGAHQKVIMSHSNMLKREQAATLIDDGGEWLKHCSITGFDKAAPGDLTPKNDNGCSAALCDITGGNGSVDAHGTTYFLKFDSGKTHHRGDLPSNLVARLLREKKDKGSIKYLSTGCSYSVGGGHRCYYAEFDNGECWWGTNKDEVLDKIFMELDVHRVAFGSSSGTSGDKSSWVVIGKDGTVKWRNVPQGLHDVLIAQDSGAFAITIDDDYGGGVSSIRDHAFSHAAPCEVSLGIGGTYFIRFLDERVDYSLPNFVADVFDKFEVDGKRIRAVALHVDTYDCLIRYAKDSGDVADF